MFESAKLVVVSGLPAMSEAEKKHFKTIIENLSENIFLIFFMLDANKYKNLYSFAKSNCKMYETEDEISISSFNAYVNKRLHELGIEIKTEDVEYMAQNLQKTNNNKFFSTDTIEILLAKLILFADNKKTFDRNDIFAIVDNSNNYIIWDLFNACDQKDYVKCLNLFSQCVSNHYDAVQAANEVLSIFAWKYRMLLACKEKVAQKMNTQQICKFVSDIKKVNFVGTGLQVKSVKIEANDETTNGKNNSLWSYNLCEQSMNGFYGKKPSIDVYSRKELFVIVETIQNLMVALRSCRMQTQAYLLLDLLFATICREMNDEIINKIKTSLYKMDDYEKFR
jgi:hypothetical protein